MANLNHGRPHLMSHNVQQPMVIINAPPNDGGRPSSHYPTPPSLPRPTPQQRQIVDQDMDIKPVITSQYELDYSVLLLSLADHYVSTARRLAPRIAHCRDGVDVARYHELISAGLRCMECSLCHPNFCDRPPRQEAVLRLKFASLLFEETTNYEKIEELLTKSIISCQNNRFPDLGYSTHHLLVRVLAKTNLRAALKHVDHVISESETLGSAPWVYAFHFLRASLLLQGCSARDVHSALMGLKRVFELARQRGDAEIMIVVSLMQAAIHLRAGKEDSSAEAQRALATARAQLSNFSTKDLPQLYVLVHQLDLASSLSPYDHQQTQAKLKAMQQLMDNELSGTKWRRDRAFYVRMNTSRIENLIAETGGLFVREEGRGMGLTFSWLGRIEAYASAFLLSAIGSFQKNARKKEGEEYLREAFKSTSDDHLVQDAPSIVPLSVECQNVTAIRRTRCVILLQLSFACCFRADWQAAHTELQRARQLVDGTEDTSGMLNATLQYLEGTIKQGLGQFDGALQIYQSPTLTLDSHDANVLSPIKILCILARLNTLLIVHSPNHPQHSLVPGQLEQLRHYFPVNDPNGVHPSFVSAQHLDLTSAFSFVMAVLQQDREATKRSGNDTIAKNIIASKQALSASLNAAQKAANPLLMALCLSYMHHLFFGGIFDKQSMQIAQGGCVQAQDAGNQMWADIAKSKLNQFKASQRPQ